ncbi:hypothetical protein [Paraburkholderia bannensis]|uniref:hypothetical protein n=1 Tax=Paraburkholderia bannensis TaxID=765414 RepID=UPI0005AA58D4|nr:hypothetical protein [Paraburkholderia bannensis]
MTSRIKVLRSALRTWVSRAVRLRAQAEVLFVLEDDIRRINMDSQVDNAVGLPIGILEELPPSVDVVDVLTVLPSTDEI